MALTGSQFVSDTTGDVDETVRLVVGGKEIVIATGWDIQEGVLSQPSAWGIELGWGGVAAPILQAIPPRTPFQLYVGKALQFSGYTDYRGATQSANGGTSLQIGGRDALAPLESSDVTAEISIENPTYPRIVWRAMQQVGLAPKNVPEPDPKILHFSNAANRNIKSGVKVVEILPVVTVTEFLSGKLGIGGEASGQCRSKVGETWHHFCRRYLDRAGLFLWANADGTFTLSAPNVNQPPTYELVRRRNRNKSNAIGAIFREDTTGRHSEYTVYARTGGKKHGATKAKGSFVDQEMVDFGFTYPGCLRDAAVQSAAEAAFLARRKLAEERRSGFRLSYQFPGHSLPVFQGKGQRAIVVPDTILHVDDEELGFARNFYVESVRKRRGPGTTTEVHLMRTEDVIFGGQE